MTSFQVDAKSTALILIDLQRGIVTRPLAPYTGAETLERTARLVEAFRQRGGTIIFVRVEFTEMLSLPTDAPGRDPNDPPPPAAALVLAPESGYQAGDLVVTKRQWGAFYGTDLDQQLRRRGIRTLVLGGIATNFGVESTARAALDRGYALVFAEDAMTGLSAEAHDFAVQNIFPRMGRVRKTNAVLEALTQ